MNKREFTDAVKEVTRITRKKTVAPATGFVAVNALEDHVEISATDFETTVTFRIPGAPRATGQAVVLGEVLAGVARALPNVEDIAVAVEPGALEITAGEYEVSIQSKDLDPLAALKAPEGAQWVVVDAADFVRAVKETAFAVDEADTERAITGVLVEFCEDRVTLVATNAYRMAVCEIAASVPEGMAKAQTVVPPDALRLAASAADKACAIHITDNRTFFDVGRALVAAQNIASTFPEWRRIFPEEAPTAEGAVGHDGLLNAARMAYVFSKNSRNMLELSIDDDFAFVSAEGYERGKFHARLEAAGGRGSETVYLNAVFLLDVLTNATSGEWHLALYGDAKPVIVTGDFSKHLIMPMLRGV